MSRMWPKKNDPLAFGQDWTKFEHESNPYNGYQTNEANPVNVKLMQVALGLGVMSSFHWPLYMYKIYIRRMSCLKWLKNEDEKWI